MHNRLVACYYNTASRICGGLNYLRSVNELNDNYVLAIESHPMAVNNNNKQIGVLSQIYDGLLFSQRNSKVPDKANHGARPCSHVYRYIKVEEKWFGPRWYRKALKKKFRNSENKIHP